ncbi:kynurenine aminotransferase [Chrysoperla carnea]|uniref:kynurenine aminotransferase n=1 Tax=Chrysoperla carnea TaxID=189513 RepID=UPI001D0756C2|nr:kynurenine aminotransferase [Chrysoperla carnea]
MSSSRPRIRKRLSGAANRKRAAEKLKKVEEVMSKTAKLTTFFEKKEEVQSYESNYFGHKQEAAMSTSTQKGDANKFKLPKRYEGSEKSVWVEYIQLALDHKPLNLGQGFADFAPPDYISKALAEVSTGENVLYHQYTRGFGHPRLVNALSKLYSQLIGRQINPNTEILVTAGAYEALYSTIVGHVDDGDEVIIIEPYFDCYEPMVLSAGGVPRYIPLKPKKTSGVIHSSDWVLDNNELEKLFNEKTKMIIINTPHNPLGKVFTESELQVIADLCKKWNVLCVSDEVYEWLVYKPHKHVRIATLPGMWERTITIGSAGKTFSITGWKTGWAYGPANLMVNLQMIHQNCIYTCNTPCQEAVARGFELELNRLGSEESYFKTLPKELEAKRDYMVKFLSDVGMVPTIPDGGFFLVADWTPLEKKVDLTTETDRYKDYRFTKWMTKNIKFQGIPPSAFYSAPHKPLAEDYVRYCFIKKDETLKEAAEILKKWSTK